MRTAARLAALVLLVHAVALVVPIVHEADDLSRAEAAAGLVSSVGPACGPDCRVPGHEHHGHDPATCASCRVGHDPRDAARSRSLDPPALLPVAVAPRTTRPEPRESRGPSPARGPPAPRRA